MEGEVKFGEKAGIRGCFFGAKSGVFWPFSGQKVGVEETKKDESLRFRPFLGVLGLLFDVKYKSFSLGQRGLNSRILEKFIFGLLHILAKRLVVLRLVGNSKPHLAKHDIIASFLFVSFAPQAAEQMQI